MNLGKNCKRELYCSHYHEWIDFQGKVAYIGVSSFKLKGIKQIDILAFTKNDSFKQGEVIATIKYDDYLISVNMPVTGKIIQINEELSVNKQNVLIEYLKAGVDGINNSHPAF